MKNSLVSHITGNTVHSLIAKNCTETFFKSQKSLSIKTYDKQYSIEVVDKEMIDSKFVIKYLKYLTKHSLLFLPLIVGAYTVKINNFSKLYYRRITERIFQFNEVFKKQHRIGYSQQR